VGSLINTVVNTATEFAAGVNHGIAAGSNAPNPGTTYCPSSEPGYGSGGGQEYWDNEDINLPVNQVPSEIHVNVGALIFSLDYSINYNPNTGKVVDRVSISGGGTIGYDALTNISSPIGWSIMVKNIDVDFDTYLNTPATATLTAGYNFGGEVSLGDSNGDGKLEVFSHGIGIASRGVSTSYGAPLISGAIFSNGGVIHNFIDRMRGG